MVTRRSTLFGLSATLVAPIVAAMGPKDQLQLAVLRYMGNWNSRPNAAHVWSQEVRFRTSIDVRLDKTQDAALPLTSPALFERPLAILTGDARFRLSPAERNSLKKWIESGGFLIVDNTGQTQPSEAFDQSVRTEFGAVFPGRELIKVPASHVLFRTLYKLDYPSGRAIHHNFVEGLFIDDRLAVVYIQNDLTGALDRDRIGAWSHDVVPGGEPQRELAIRMAVNMVMYAMCLDYKDDQVHRSYLLKARRWQIKPPEIQTP